MEDDGWVGYVKYEGELVEDGMMDARKQAQALYGIDSLIRYFLGRTLPGLKGLDFEIPVRVEKGSWQALIPETVVGWGQAGLAVIATAYFSKAAQKMAENDFGEVGAKEIFKKSFEGIKWFAKIGRHVGDLSVKKFEHSKFDSDRGLVGVYNDAGGLLYVPKDFLELYATCNPKILEQLVSLVEHGRELKIGSYGDHGIDEVSIAKAERSIFAPDADENNDHYIFPELEHGEDVVLEGEVTRENKTSNSMGFKYKNHILTSYPDVGSIVQYKDLLFAQCRLYGVVSRLDEKGGFNARRPKLIFSHLEPLRKNENLDLFD